MTWRGIEDILELPRDFFVSLLVREADDCSPPLKRGNGDCMIYVFDAREPKSVLSGLRPDGSAIADANSDDRLSRARLIRSRFPWLLSDLIL